MSSNRRNGGGEDGSNPHNIEVVDSSEVKEKKSSSDLKYNRLDFAGKIRTVRFWRPIVYIFLWLIALKLIEKHTGFGTVYIALSVFAFIFMNLDNRERKPGELSAYSIFNEGATRILGDNTDSFLQSFGIGTGNRANDEPAELQRNPSNIEVSLPKDNKEWMKQISKMGNKPCYCGSDKKYKKCCYYRELKLQHANSDQAKKKVMQDYKDSQLEKNRVDYQYDDEDD